MNEHILSVEIHLTTICNLKCPICAISKNPSKKTNLKINELLKYLESLPNLKKILLCGNEGEPLLYNNIEKFIKWCKLKNMQLKINTNGAVGNNIIKMLKKNNYKNLIFEVAVDGIDDKTHQITRPGIELSIIDNFIKELDTNVVFTKYKHNQTQEKQIRKKYKKISVRNTRFEDKENNLEFPQGFDNLYLNNYSINSPMIKKTFIKVFNLNVIYNTHIYIDKLGDIYPCDVISRYGRKSIYNINNIEQIDLNVFNTMCLSEKNIHACIYSCKYDIT